MWDLHANLGHQVWWGPCRTGQTGSSQRQQATFRWPLCQQDIFSIALHEGGITGVAQNDDQDDGGYDGSTEEIRESAGPNMDDSYEPPRISLDTVALRGEITGVPPPEHPVELPEVSPQENPVELPVVAPPENE